MNKKGFAGIAYAYPLSLGIHDNVCCHFRIGCLIYINMTVSGTCLDDRNRTLIYHCFDQPFSSAGDQHIHIFIHFHKFPGGFSGGILNQLNGILCNSLSLQGFADTFHNCLIGMNGITSAFQDHNVSRFKTKPESICGYVGTRFINNSDNSKRNSFLSDQKSVGTFFHSGNFSHRIFQIYKLAKSVCHSFDSFSGKKKSVHQTFRHMICLTVFYIFLICF